MCRIFSRILLGIFSATLTFTVGWAQPTTEWLATYDGPALWDDFGVSLAVGEEGAVYVAGTSWGTQSWLDYVVIKYTPQGVESWVSRYNGTANDADQLTAMALDAAGNVYVTGGSICIGSSTTSCDYVTVKYDAEGAERWVARYDGPGQGLDYASALALDATGNVYVTGKSAGAGSLYDFATIKYNNEGQVQWVARYNSPSNFNDEALAIAVDPMGNVLVTGSTLNLTSNINFLTVKYNSAGIQQWAVEYTGPGAAWDIANCLAVNSSGEVYVGGYSYGSGTAKDYILIKYNPAGVQQWVASYNGPGNGDDVPNALVLDALGAIYITGESAGEGTNLDYATIKYNANGIQQWVARYNGIPNSSDRARALSRDEEGNVFVTGESTTEGNFTDYATVKYSPAGVQEWVESFNGLGGGTDVASAVKTDALGYVYVTGWSDGTNTGKDIVTIKYNQALPSPVMIMLDPINPPIQIPAFGGNFAFNISVNNMTPLPQSFTLWTLVELPGGTWYGPIIGPLHLTINPAAGLSRLRTQAVPAAAPAGTYSYWAYVGAYPDPVWDDDSFPFTKLGVRDWGLGSGDWTNTGDDFTADVGAHGCAPTSGSGPEGGLGSTTPTTVISPNPFNSATTLSFFLPEATCIDLNLYNIHGQLAARLFEGWRDIGDFQATLDGSELASGIYFCLLTTASSTSIEKIVLLK